MTIDIKTLADRVESGVPDRIDHPESRAYYQSGPFTASCPDDPAAKRALAKRLRKGAPRLGSGIPTHRRPSTSRAPFDWGVVRRFIQDGETCNALEYLDLYGVEPVTAVSVGGGLPRILVDAVPFDTGWGATAYSGRLWLGNCWTWEAIERHTGRGIIGPLPKHPESKKLTRPTTRAEVQELAQKNGARVTEHSAHTLLQQIEQARTEYAAATRLAELLRAT